MLIMTEIVESQNFEFEVIFSLIYNESQINKTKFHNKIK